MRNEFFHVLEYHELDALINNLIEIPERRDFECVPFWEWNNDSCYKVEDVSKDLKYAEEYFEKYAKSRIEMLIKSGITSTFAFSLHDIQHKPLLWVFLVIFHVCVLLLILGHLELFGEIAIIQTIPHEVFLGAGYVGLFSLIALLYFLFRRFRSPVRELSVPEDYYLLILLFLIVIFGSQMDWARRWYGYSSIEVEHYRAYLSSLLFLKPELPAELTGMGHSFMLVIHVFLANLFLIFFPFSHTMHSFLALPINKLRRG